jgi:hypothetical protein
VPNRAGNQHAAQRLIGLTLQRRDGPKRVIVQNAVAAASVVFSSASQATTRSGRSMLGLVRRRHAFEARSAADGRSLVGADRAMICTMNALAMRKA